MLKQVSARPDCKTVKPCHKERKREEEQKKRRGNEAEGVTGGDRRKKGKHLHSNGALSDCPKSGDSQRTTW